MSRFLIASEAKNDLQEIWLYLSTENEVAANKVIQEIVRRFAILADFPLMGKERKELFPKLRSFPVDSYVIFYQPIENGIEVLRILHGSRDIYESLF